MRIVTLNCWGGREFDRLMQFVETFQHFVDVWCFQEMPLGTVAEYSDEVRHNLLREILIRLSNFTAFTYPAPINEFRGKPLANGTNVGLATLVRSNHTCGSVTQLALYDSESEHAKALPRRTGTGHLLTVEITGPYRQPCIVGNVHGLWTPDDKGDTPDRIAQSCKLVDFAREQVASVILAGDFNFAPDTQSSRLLEEIPMQNLVSRCGVPTTRTSLYTGSHPHADNFFVGNKIKVDGFRALPEIVSDHFSLFLEVYTPW